MRQSPSSALTQPQSLVAAKLLQAAAPSGELTATAVAIKQNYGVEYFLVIDYAIYYK